MLTLNGISKAYGATDALSNVSLTLPAGHIVGLLGPNGSGKTTLLKIIAGMIVDHRGVVRIEGQEPGPETKSMVSYLSDTVSLPAWMKPRDALRYFADFYADFDVPRAEAMFTRFGIEGNKRIGQMSKGTQEKLHIILAMSRRAKLFLLDEPLGGIDPSARAAMLDIILSNYDQQALVLLSTHLIHDVERIFDSAIFLKDGRIALQSDVDTLREETGHSLEEHFLEVFACSAN